MHCNDIMKNFIPAEWAPQDAIIIGFPSHQDLWPGALLAEAQQEVAVVCNALAESQTCYVLVANTQALTVAKRLLTSQAHILQFDFGDIWFRDTGPIFFNPEQAVRFRHNGWGGKYRYPFDDSAAERLVDVLGVSDTKHYDFILEGGALEHNGEGGILTTRQCLLHANRNGWNQAEAEAHLMSVFNGAEVYWLEEGLAWDHTDGHIDNAARFIDRNTVICQHANGDDDPNATRYQQHLNTLSQQGWDVVTVPSPGLIRDHEGHTTPASHLNFMMGNECVIFPNYLKATFADKRCVDETKALLADKFPKRDIVSAPSNAILTGGGSFHCLSQHIPTKISA